MKNRPSHTSPTRERLWSPIFVTIIAAMLFAFMVGQGVNSGTTVYLERTGGSLGLAGIGAMTFSVSAAVMRLISGPLIDNRGRRIVMMLGAAIMLIGTLGPLFANDGSSFIIWRALQGIGFSASTTAANTAAADVLPFSRLGEGIGYAGLGQAISMSIGPALALFLVSTNPPENLYFGLIACAALSLVLSVLCRYEKDPTILPKTSEYRTRWESGKLSQNRISNTNDTANTTGTLAETTSPTNIPNEDAKRHSPFVIPSGGAKRRSRRNPGLHPSPNPLRRMVNAIFEPTALRGTFVILLMATTFSFNIFFMGSFGNALHVTNAGLYYTVMAIVMILIRIGAGRFMDSVAPLKLMSIASICGAIAFALGIGCATGVFGNLTEALFYAMGLPFGICMGLGIPVNQTIAVKLTPPERWGAANALFMLGVDISNAAASVAWGFLIQSLGYAAALIGCIIMIGLAFAAAAIFYPKD